MNPSYPRRFAPFKTLIIVLILLFLVEAGVMALINFLQFPAFVEAVLDSSALIFLAIPVLYLMFIRPMIKQYEANERAKNIIETMYSTSTALAKNLDVDWVMAVLFEQTRRLIPINEARLYLLQSPDQLIVRAVKNDQGLMDGERDGMLGAELVENNLMMRVVNEQKSRMIADISTVEGQQLGKDRIRQGSWMGIPLIAQGKVIGLCEFTHIKPGLYTQESLQLAEGVVSQAAFAVQNAALYDQVRTAHEQLQNLTHKIVTFQEHERRYLAKVLYDEVGQSVIGVKLRLSALEASGPLPQMLYDQVAQLEKDLGVISKQLHDLANDLRPASLDFLGLQAALQQYAAHLQANSPTPLNIHIQTNGLQCRLPEATEIMLFRIAQEALTNAIKHAQASAVQVYLRETGEGVMLMIEDDGVGFSIDAVNPDQSMGLLAMRERAEIAGGKLTIESVPGSGTAVCLSVPCFPR